MNKKKLVIISLTAIIGIVIVPLLIFAWHLLPPGLVLPRLETVVVYQGVISGQYSDSVIFKALLTEKASEKVIHNRKIEFILEDQTVTAQTDINGIAIIPLILNQAAGYYSLLTIFGGDEQFHGSSDSTSFEILKEDTILTYTGPLSGVQDSTISLSVQLSEKDLEFGNLEGKIIIFDLAGLSVRTATNKQGKAEVDLELDLSPGIHILKTEFLGDAVYLGSSDVDTFEVKPVPAPGPPGCFIATVVFDSPLAPELDTLRQFRDEYLLTNQFGVLVVRQYERFSPLLANFITQNGNLKGLVRIGLRPLIEILELLIIQLPVKGEKEIKSL